MRLYEHTAEQPLPPDGVTGEAIRHLHTHMLPRDARCLRNQVVCMIAEYHLTSSARVSSTLSPVLLEAAKPLLPALKSYIPNISFEGSRDVRVLDRAKALQVAVWLHRLEGMRWLQRHWTHLSIVWDASWSPSWFPPLMASHSGRSWRVACMKISVTLNTGWTNSSHAIIKFTKNSMALWRPTGWPPELHERGSRRTWTFNAETSRASECASCMRNPTSGRTLPKGMSKTNSHIEMLRPRYLLMPELMTLPLRVPQPSPWLSS